MGGPNWDINTYGVPSHPFEGRTGGFWEVTPSSNEWWRYTIRVTRETSGGDGRYEMWMAGSNPGAGPGTPEGRRMTGVKIMDYNGVAGQCEAGLIHTSTTGYHLLNRFFIGGTTSGHSWPNGSDGAYIDWDAVRVWTER